MLKVQSLMCWFRSVSRDGVQRPRAGNDS